MTTSAFPSRLKSTLRLEECIYHRGEIMCLMWQIDAEPPYTDYPGFLLKTGKLKVKGKAKARK
jgi:uncharacterized damage-inducible protein DinB